MQVDFRNNIITHSRHIEIVNRGKVIYHPTHIEINGFIIRAPLVNSKGIADIIDYILLWDNEEQEIKLNQEYEAKHGRKRD